MPPCCLSHFPATLSNPCKEGHVSAIARAQAHSIVFSIKMTTVRQKEDLNSPPGGTWTTETVEHLPKASGHTAHFYTLLWLCHYLSWHLKAVLHGVTATRKVSSYWNSVLEGLKGWIWPCTSIIPTFRRLRQVYHRVWALVPKIQNVKSSGDSIFIFAGSGRGKLCKPRSPTCLCYLPSASLRADVIAALSLPAIASYCLEPRPFKRHNVPYVHA